MRSDSLYSCKQRFTFEDLFGDDSKLLLLTGLPQNPLLKTKLNKKRQKNHKQCPSNVHDVRNWNHRYIVSGTMVCKYTIQRIIHALPQKDDKEGLSKLNAIAVQEFFWLELVCFVLQYGFATSLLAKETFWCLCGILLLLFSRLIGALSLHCPGRSVPLKLLASALKACTCLPS